MTSAPAAFGSILFRDGSESLPDQLGEPEFFHDLNIDQIVDSITAGRDCYNLKPFFYFRLASPVAIYYRHEVLRDLEHAEVRKLIDAFAQHMQHMREHLTMAGRLRYRYQKERLFLDAVLAYGTAVRSLAQDLPQLSLSSDGLLAFRDYLMAYAESDDFTDLCRQASQLDDALSGIKYSLHIKGSRIRVSAYEGEPDYSDEVRETFAKFRQGGVTDYRARFMSLLEMGDVEAGILDLIARLYPGVFEELDSFRGQYPVFADELLTRFDREIQFYLAYLDYLAPLRAVGLSFCYPRVSADSKEIYAADMFDLALARNLVADQAPVVGNDVRLEGAQRLLVVTGPNQGGKTTLARALGQLCYLAGIGCLVPGREARLFLAGNLLTHFEREEDLSNLSGRLQDDLQRIRLILRQATGSSVIILNEIFTSTTPADALYLSSRILDQIARLDALCVCVTFLDELASFSPSTVSMVAMIVPEHPELRTFKILQRPADGFAYAAAIAEKYGLTYDKVKARVTS